jgi:hypothetical protein
LGLAAALAGACDRATGPDPYFPAGAVRLDPLPVIYGQWWRDIEACAERHASFDGVRFYVLPGVAGWDQRDVFLYGAWTPRGNRITVGELVRLHPGVVRHEMLHAVLRRGDHPPEYFGTRCGAFVDVSDLF